MKVKKPQKIKHRSDFSAARNRTKLHLLKFRCKLPTAANNSCNGLWGAFGKVVKLQNWRWGHV